MSEKKRIELTRLQGIIAVASFVSGIVSELLVLCGAILGVKASYDVKFRKFEAELQDVIDNEKKLNTQTDNE